MTNERSVRWGRSTLVACFLAGGLTAGCGQEAPESAPAPAAGSKTAVAGGGASALELKRISDYLDSHYRRSDVRHAFRTRFGESIDCVAADAQPGLHLGGVPSLERAPAPPPSHAVPDPNIVPVVDGALDDDGNLRACPPDSVPIVRTQPEQIMRAGGLDRWMENAGRKAGHGFILSSAPPIQNGYSYAIGTMSVPGTTVRGIKSTLAVYDPLVQGGVDHSLSQVWATSYAQGEYPCGSSCLQSLEAGWNVDENLYHDGGDDGGASHLFIFATKDGYTNSGCYNLITSCTSGGGPSSGSGFVMLAGAKYTPGQVLISSFPGATPAEVSIEWFTGGPGVPYWYLYVNGSAIGYIPYSFFRNGQGGLEPLSSGYVDHFEAGGEVYDPRQESTMGSGQLPTTGYKHAAYHRNVTYYGDTFDGSGDVTTVTPAISTFASDPTLYSVSKTVTAGATGWGGYFYFGGAGKP